MRVVISANFVGVCPGRYSSVRARLADAAESPAVDEKRIEGAEKVPRGTRLDRRSRGVLFPVGGFGPSGSAGVGGSAGSRWVWPSGSGGSAGRTAYRHFPATALDGCGTSGPGGAAFAGRSARTFRNPRADRGRRHGSGLSGAGHPVGSDRRPQSAHRRTCGRTGNPSAILQ